jgi:putative membrane protein
MNLNKKILVCVAAAATLVTSALAELSHADKQFFEKAAKAGMKEVEISQGALTHLSSPDVRDFAQMMVSDHTQANAGLQALAQQKGVVLPAPNPKIERKWSDNAKDVEDEYLATMASEHKEAVELFEKASKSADPDIAAFAQKTLPTLQHHLEMAKQLKKTH